jgi:hypothetical protein
MEGLQKEQHSLWKQRIRRDTETFLVGQARMVVHACTTAAYNVSSVNSRVTFFNITGRPSSTLTKSNFHFPFSHTGL